MNVFIREAPIKENTASECIRTAAATYDCKILQLYKYGASEYGSPGGSPSVKVARVLVGNFHDKP